MADKTNVVRIFDRAKIDYKYYADICDNAVNAVELAQKLGKDCREVYKTLVTVGKSRRNYVFVIPADAELDLKKAANAVGEKSVEMLKLKDLLPTTGYVHGGCSPVGMKKFFTTTIDKSAEALPSITFSAGRVGHQVETSLAELAKVVKFSAADIVKDHYGTPTE